LKAFNNQFATQKLRQEISTTGTGATFTPGTGEQFASKATKNIVKKKIKKEDKNIPSNWKDAPSIPNRPSKGGYIYKQLFEKLSEFVKENKQNLEVDDKVKVTYGNEFYGKIGKIVDIRGGFVVVGFMYDQDGDYLDWDESLEDDREIDVEEYSMHSSDVQKIEDEDETELVQDPKSKEFTRKIKISPNDKETIRKIQAMMAKEKNLKKEKEGENMINEGYAKFRNETKVRPKPDQFHQAIRQVRQKVQEINRLFEYVSRLKSELSEGEDGLKYKMHTEKALAKIKEMVASLNQNVKKFK